ncbi:MAG: 2-amino-4-hydroxy-6-hydroxymethyldihydropteridine diphosphokinase [Treponema sp.]|nr:2-amino-4-hydroxy-6-hydroxymethyldihydropteridine diphosphokinase [Treponema sp.]
MKRVILGLGSNTEFNGKSSIELLSNACRRLSGIMSGIVISSLYMSKAMYVVDQSDFYNMAVRGFVEESTDPLVFLRAINEIEAEYGRDRTKEIRFGPRPLDIDIEEFGDDVIHSELLEVPHPRMHEREFVLIPTLEILDESADSKLRETLCGYLKELSPQGVERCPEEMQVLFGTLCKADQNGNKESGKSGCNYDCGKR